MGGGDDVLGGGRVHVEGACLEVVAGACGTPGVLVVHEDIDLIGGEGCGSGGVAETELRGIDFVGFLGTGEELGGVEGVRRRRLGGVSAKTFLPIDDEMVGLEGARKAILAGIALEIVAPQVVGAIEGLRRGREVEVLGFGVEVAFLCFIIAYNKEAHRLEADALAGGEGEGHAVLQEAGGEVEGGEG